MATASEGKPETEMERAVVFVRVRVGIEAVIQSNRTDGQFVTQTDTERVTQIVEAGFFGRRQKISGIGKERALKLADNWKRVFDIEDGEKFAADGIAFGIVRTELALAKTAHGGGAAIKEAFVDWDFVWFGVTRGAERMNDAHARAESERGLLDPALQRRANGR